MSEQNNHDEQTHSLVTISIGTQVSHYRIIERIEFGAMGEVYLAEDCNLQRKVAIKFLALRLVHNEQFKARFTREAQAIAKLNRPTSSVFTKLENIRADRFWLWNWLKGKR